MTTPDTQILAQASLFRKMRALCRTMRKTEWEFRRNLYGMSKSNFIRQKGEEDSCPLTFTWYAATGQLFAARDWDTVAIRLGFTEIQGDEIVMAADHGGKESISSKARIRIRRILLRAAGLKEPCPS